VVRATCIVVAVIAAVASANAPASVRAAQVSDFSIVQIRGTSPDGPALGAGVIINKRGYSYEILTSKHVMTMREVSVTFNDGVTTSFVRTIAAAPRDLAVVKVELADPDSSFNRGFYPAVTLARTSPRAGDPLTVIGHAHGYLNARADAVMYGPVEETFALLCDACDLGDSGGGIFDRTGDLVGIFSGVGHVATYEQGHMIGGPTRVAFEEPVEQIGALLAQSAF